jgi:predicted RNase H-like HicB family nuclease
MTKSHPNRNYIGIVHRHDDGTLGIHFADVPGCVSAGDTIDELLVHASEALALHLEDGPLPDARSLEAVKADAHVARDLAAGGSLLAVPFRIRP